MSGQVSSAVHRSLVPSCAPATEYVAMPDGSSSAAPVITPGPSDFDSSRIHRTGANVGTKEVECNFPVDHPANSLTASHAAPCESGPKVVECDQTPVLATFIMQHREE